MNQFTYNEKFPSSSVTWATDTQSFWNESMAKQYCVPLFSLPNKYLIYASDTLGTKAILEPMSQFYLWMIYIGVYD